MITRRPHRKRRGRLMKIRRYRELRALYHPCWRP